MRLRASDLSVLQLALHVFHKQQHWVCLQDKRITACSSQSVARIASEETGVAEMDIPLLKRAAEMKLYPDIYTFDINTK